MDVQIARRLAITRLFSVLRGDIQGGGIATALSALGYSEEDILLVDEQYRALIERLEEDIA